MHELTAVHDSLMYKLQCVLHKACTYVGIGFLS